MAVNFSEFHVKNNLCGKKTTYVKNHPFRSRQSTPQSFRPRKSTQETTRKKTHQPVEGKAPVLRIICKGLENGL